MLEKDQTLKQHWQLMHPEELRKIRKWLGETEAKIASHEILAREGLDGRGKDQIPGPSGIEHIGERRGY